MLIPKGVHFIIQTLNNNKYEAFVVGGCVRDSIMGKEPKDFDITTSALPLEVKPLFKKTVDTGLKHGTITVVLNEGTFEVTTYRIDGEYKDCRRPSSVLFTKNLIDDLKRRDFTINAIAYHEEAGFIDPFNGIEDIKKKNISAVGNPNTRFEEDALRLLRCIRFSAQLDFNVETTTYDALIKNAYLISNISIERIRDELSKIFLAKYLKRSNILVNSKIVSYINVELHNYLECHLNSSIPYMEKANKDIVDTLVILFRYLNYEKAIEFMKFLKFSNQNIKEVSILIKYLNTKIEADLYNVRKSISILNKETFFKLINIKEILGENINDIMLLSNQIVENNDPITLKDLNINGNILKDNKICENKNIGKVLNYLLDCVLKEPQLNTQKSLTNLAKNFSLEL